ncbi:hypothetical protein NL676_017906 [Syzygium grande]|nr:hypothetical protein NL676_017906 [Syzygium grande]
MLVSPKFSSFIESSGLSPSSSCASFPLADPLAVDPRSDGWSAEPTWDLLREESPVPVPVPHPTGSSERRARPPRPRYSRGPGVSLSSPTARLSYF